MVSQVDYLPTILDYIGFGEIAIDNSPGRSFADVLRGRPMLDWENEVFFEHLESRSIRTPQFFYTKRLEGIGDNELYDLVADPGQIADVKDHPEYTEIDQELDNRLSAFFNRYADSQYDLWKGGRPKVILYRPWLFRKLYGDQWGPTTEAPPTFQEEVRF